jgi:hypothetical protein
MTDPIRATFRWWRRAREKAPETDAAAAIRALTIIEEWAEVGKVEIARSLMGKGYEVGHLASNSVAVRETVAGAVLAAAKDQANG